MSITSVTRQEVPLTEENELYKSRQVLFYFLCFLLACCASCRHVRCSN